MKERDTNASEMANSNGPALESFLTVECFAAKGSFTRIVTMPSVTACVCAIGPSPLGSLATDNSSPSLDWIPRLCWLHLPFLAARNVHSQPEVG